MLFQSMVLFDKSLPNCSHVSGSVVLEAAAPARVAGGARVRDLVALRGRRGRAEVHLALEEALVVVADPDRVWRAEAAELMLLSLWMEVAAAADVVDAGVRLVAAGAGAEPGDDEEAAVDAGVAQVVVAGEAAQPIKIWRARF